jgi:hypothetical protein
MARILMTDVRPRGARPLSSARLRAGPQRYRRDADRTKNHQRNQKPRKNRCNRQHHPISPQMRPNSTITSRGIMKLAGNARSGSAWPSSDAKTGRVTAKTDGRPGAGDGMTTDDLIGRRSGRERKTHRCQAEFRRGRKGLGYRLSEPLSRLARPERFELPTPWFVARYSIQLSYGRFDWGSEGGEPIRTASMLAPLRGNWRRERDSNPRWSFMSPYSLSRGAPSAARPSLRQMPTHQALQVLKDNAFSHRRKVQSIRSRVA